MSHDHAADHPRRGSPAGGIGELEFAFLVLEADILRLAEGLAKEMAGSGLQGLAILHHRFDRIGRIGTGETFIFRLLSGNDRHRQHVFRKRAVHFQYIQRFFHRFGFRRMRRMAFLPQKFAGPQEHSGAHFPAHDIRPLVDHHRQIAPALHPTRKGSADHGFRCWPNHQRFFQFGIRINNQPAIFAFHQPMMRDNRHFLGKAFNMLGFLGEIAERNEQRKIAIFMAGRLDPLVHQILHPFPDAIAPRPHDHTATHTGFFGEIGFGNYLLVPSREIVSAGDGKSIFLHLVFLRISSFR